MTNSDILLTVIATFLLIPFFIGVYKDVKTDKKIWEQNTGKLISNDECFEKDEENE